MRAVRLICAAVMRGAPPIKGPISIKLEAIFARPVSMSRRMRGKPKFVWRTGRPDADNLAKLVGDALNGIAWIDDAQITMMNIWKHYGDVPELRVRIEALG